MKGRMKSEKTIHSEKIKNTGSKPFKMTLMNIFRNIQGTIFFLERDGFYERSQVKKIIGEVGDDAQVSQKRSK